MRHSAHALTHGLSDPQEADYVRSGNTKRVTNLRKEQQDNLWEGIVQSAFSVVQCCLAHNHTL